MDRQYIPLLRRWGQYRCILTPTDWFLWDRKTSLQTADSLSIWRTLFPRPERIPYLSGERCSQPWGIPKLSGERCSQLWADSLTIWRTLFPRPKLFKEWTFGDKGIWLNKHSRQEIYLRGRCSTHSVDAPNASTLFNIFVWLIDCNIMISWWYCFKNC